MVNTQWIGNRIIRNTEMTQICKCMKIKQLNMIKTIAVR